MCSERGFWGRRKWPQASRIRRPQVRRAGVLRKNGSKRIVYSKNSLVKNSRGLGAGAENRSPRSPRGMRPARAGSLGSHFWAFPARTGANVVTGARFRFQKSPIERDLGYSVCSEKGFWGRRKWPQASRIRRPPGPACGEALRN